MKYDVEITDKANEDLRNIYEYIAFELCSVNNAIRQLTRLESHILNLESFPEKYRRYPKEPWYSNKLRIMPVDNYVVLFIVENIDKKVTVTRVMYAGRNIESHL